MARIQTEHTMHNHLRAYFRNNTAARRAQRRGDPKTAEHWMRCAERNLRLSIWLDEVLHFNAEEEPDNLPRFLRLLDRRAKRRLAAEARKQKAIAANPQPDFFRRKMDEFLAKMQAEEQAGAEARRR
jgi:hypothetical protein